MTDKVKVAIEGLHGLAYWLARFSDHGNHMHIPGPNSGVCYKASEEIKKHIQTIENALAARSDVPRQQIAGVVILDYDYEGDALAGVHHGGCGAAGRMDA